MCSLKAKSSLRDYLWPFWKRVSWCFRALPAVSFCLSLRFIREVRVVFESSELTFFKSFPLEFLKWLATSLLGFQNLKFKLLLLFDTTSVHYIGRRSTRVYKAVLYTLVLRFWVGVRGLRAVQGDLLLRIYMSPTTLFPTGWLFKNSGFTGTKQFFCLRLLSVFPF